MVRSWQSETLLRKLHGVVPVQVFPAVHITLPDILLIGESVEGTAAHAVPAHEIYLVPSEFLIHEHAHR